MANFDDPSFFESSIFNFDPSHLAPPPPDAGPSKNHRSSISSASPSDLFATLSPAASSTAGFGPPSLHHTSSTTHSPRSSASPPSLLSMSDSELDDLLNFGSSGSGEDSFSFNMPDEMDQKSFVPQGQHHQQQQQPMGGFPLFLPNFQMGTMGNTANAQVQGPGQGQGQGGFDYARSQTDQLANMLFQQHLQQQQQQAMSQFQSTMAPEWLRNQHEVLRQQMQYSQPTQNVFNVQHPQNTPAPQASAPAPIPTAAPAPTVSDTTADVKKVKAVGRPPGRRGPKPKDDLSASAPGGKHNKTERRYREKVQAAQSNLRDSVPALRVLYGTSTEEQRRTTDMKAADGSVDGLGEITRPNASAKTTIFVGARMYIELLQDRVASLQRKVLELEDYRSAVGGQEEFELWKADFERRDQEVMEMARRLKRDSESDEDAAEEDGEEDEEEDEPSPPPPSKKRKARKTKQDAADQQTSSTTTTSAAAAVRVFAAFAMTFSFLPSAGDTFTSIPITTGTAASNPSTSQVISRLPIITAEHASRLLGRGLPSAAVPHPSTLVEWGWRVLVAVLVAIAIGPIYRRLSRSTQPGVFTTAKEAAKYAFRVESPTHPSVVQYAAGIIGGSIVPSRMSRWYTILHLNRTAVDAYSLALLALLQPERPFLPSPEQLWKQARASITESTSSSLITVVNLPLIEAEQYLSLVPPTSQPIEAMADEINLVLLNDLYSRLFSKLVSATTADGPIPSTTKALLSNLTTYDIRSELKATAFDKEIRGTVAGISKGSTSHALGLVLIGLWGVLAGPSPSSQASLATALAAEEMGGQSLSSVSAMLNLLYPGFSQSPPSGPTPTSLSPNALALDKLALVCIEYLKLVTSTTAPSGNRVETSKRIGTVTTNLRLALAQTDLQITANEHGEGDEARGLVLAKERLVGVLSAVGRRAMSRVAGRDEDSGLEAEVDEL